MQGDFLEKVEREKEASPDVFLTEALLQKQLILKKNRVLYPQRKIVLDHLKEMLADLNNAYESIFDALSPYHREGLYFYFQKALEEAMNVEPVISKKTEFESLSSEERNSIFNGNSFWQQDSHQGALKLRAQIKTAKFSSIIKMTKSIDIGVEFPKDHQIEKMLLLFLSAKHFEKMLAKQEVIPKAQQYICSRLLNFINKVKAFCEHNPEYKKELKKLRKEYKLEKLSLEDYFQPNMIQKINDCLAVIDNLLKYQALNVLKNTLKENPELTDKLKKSLKETEAHVCTVTKTEMDSRQSSDTASRMLADDRPYIEGYYSLKHLIANTITNATSPINRSEAHKGNIEIAQKATNMVITALSLSPPKTVLNDQILAHLSKEERRIALWVKEMLTDSNINELSQEVIKIPMVNRTIDDNIYLSAPWVEQISNLIKGMDQLSDMKGKKSIDHFCEHLVKLFVEFYLKEINVLREPEHFHALQ